MKRNVLETCPEDRVALHASKRDRLEKAPNTRSVAIRLKCLECCAWQPAEVRNCQIVNCALWGLGGQNK